LFSQKEDALSAERLQKVLASAGIASRRDCEELISAGRVSVNGKVVIVPGTRVDPEQDEISVDGQLIGKINPRTYVMLNKPTGVVSTADDPQGRPTVVELVDLPVRLFPVGRLDFDSEGLLLLTDDGELTQRLTHPSYQIEKEYRALLDRPPSAEALREWRNGVELDDTPTAPAWVDVLERTDDGAWVRVVLQEGRKRQIREVAKLLGYEVLRLIRVREGPVLLGDLPAGEWRKLTDEEVEALWSHVGGRDSEIPADERAPSETSGTGRGRRRVASESAASRRAPRTNTADKPADGTQEAPRRAPRANTADKPADGTQEAPRRARASQPSNERPARRRDTDTPADPTTRQDDGPRRANRTNFDARGPRRDDRAGYDNRGPRRDDRSGFDNRGPRRDDRSGFDNRGPRRDDRAGYDNRGPRRDDRGGGFGSGPRRDDRSGFDNRGSRRNDRGRYDNRGPRRDDRSGYERRPYSDDRPNRPANDDAAEHGDRPERGNERLPARDAREEKRGPGREWQERTSQERRDSNQRTAPRGGRAFRFGERGGTTRRTGFPFRPRPRRDDEDKG
jgi:23S rRNA pseudouridine2605 synthase